MDVFEVRVTPKCVKTARTVAQNREPVRLIMAPFSAKPVITFEDIPITKVARRYLIVENPTDLPLEVQIAHKNPQKAIKRVNFEWTQNTVSPGCELAVEIEWSPLETVASKATYLVTDQRGFTKELHIIFKSIGPKMMTRKPLRPRNMSAVPSHSMHTLKLKTPSPPRRPVYRNSDAMIYKANLRPSLGAGKQLSPVLRLTAGYNNSTKGNTDNKENAHQHGYSSSGLRATSPLHTKLDQIGEPIMDAVLNASDIFDKLQFTPAPKDRHLPQTHHDVVDYMASLPTPTVVPRDALENINLTQPELASKKIEWSPIYHHQPVEKGDMMTPQVINAVTSSRLSPPSNLFSNEPYHLQLPTSPIADGRRIQFEGDECENEKCDEQLLLNCSTATYRKGENRRETVERALFLTPPAVVVTPDIVEPSAVILSTTRVVSAGAEEPEEVTFLVPNSVQICRDVEKIVTTPLQKKTSESLYNLSSKKSHEQHLLKLNQGSMPNLHEIELINNIESNRYYPQVIKQRCDMSVTKTQHAPAYDNGSMILFAEEEIRAKSSCSNLNALPDNVILLKNSPATARVRCPLITLSPPKQQPRRLAASETSVQWSHAKRRNVEVHGSSDLCQRQHIKTEYREDRRRIFYDAEMHIQAAINPDPFAATTTHDPFLSATMYLNERATDKYQKQFKNWLNAMVTVPEELESAGNQVKALDVGKIFNEVRNKKEETIAQSKESISCRYFNRYRMPQLRKAAVALYMSEKIVVPLSKLDVLIEKRQIAIRDDRNLHLDLVLQRNVLELLLCFNTLWLRIGLEVVFGEEIPLQSNADIYGLTSFILNRLFRDRYLENKYNRNFALTAKYAEQIKKYSLRKLIHLLVFLDNAKEQRIVGHNPCLFTRASQYKETKEILIRLASHLIANIGDVTKYLKRLGLSLVHRQTYIDEYDYAFTNLAVDLRDGIRLTKVMEIILLRDDLTKSLRYPAVSRLQKVHNVDLALKALSEADYEIHGDIVAKDIVDGHREKTLSLLWQLIYRFRAPKFNAAAKSIQRWWRATRFRIGLTRLLADFRLKRQIEAAVVIQRYFRGYRCRKYVPIYKQKRMVASCVIQTYFRGFIARQKFKRQKAAAVVVQNWWRHQRECYRQRQEFVQLKRVTIVLQQRFRARQLMREEQQRYKQLRTVTLLIQRKWRANVERKVAQVEYQRLKRATIAMQKRYRATQMMRVQRREYQELKAATIVIQKRFRSLVLMRQVQMNFIEMHYYIVKIQRFYRGYRMMKQDREQYQRLKWATKRVQDQYRANQLMRKQRGTFKSLKAAVLTIESCYKAKVMAKVERGQYLRLRWATVTVQRQFRAQLAMREARRQYQMDRKKVIAIQRYYRGYLAMRCEKAKLSQIKWAANVIQCRYRAQRKMKSVQGEYQKQRSAIISIQRWFRNVQRTRECRQRYLKDRNAIVMVQRRWRANLEGRKQQLDYLQMRQSIIVVQRRYRAKRAMEVQRGEFKRLKELTIRLQRRWRAKALGQALRQQFKFKQGLIVTVQRKWRATMAMRRTLNDYKRLQWAARVIQRRWRAQKAMKMVQIEYQRQRKAIVCVQNRWRAIRRGRKERQQYLALKRATVIIQKHFRGQLARREAQRRIQAIKVIQKYYRSRVLAKKTRAEYELLKKTVIGMQQRWRLKRAMVHQRQDYLHSRQLIVAVQNRFRANREMRVQRIKYQQQRAAAIVIQRRFRAVQLGRQIRANYLAKRQLILRLQSVYRGNVARQRYRVLWHEKMSPEAIERRRQTAAAIRIQAQWRGYRDRKRYQSKAMKRVTERILTSRRVSDRVTAKVFLGTSMKRLKTGPQVREATKIFISLDFYSRTTPYFLIDNCGIVANYCYTVLSQAIRSEPHKFLIELCCRVALNLARYEPTKRETFLSDYLQTIAHILLRWSDKECPIFCTLCTLIYVLIQTPSHKRIIYNYMTMKDGIFILKETKKAVARKERMLTNKQRLGVFRQNLNVSSGDVADMEMLPTLECDFGIERPAHLYIFKGRLFAFETILNEMGIKLD